jgi:hypothetical protein
MNRVLIEHLDPNLRAKSPGEVRCGDLHVHATSWVACHVLLHPYPMSAAQPAQPCVAPHQAAPSGS